MVKLLAEHVPIHPDDIESAIQNDEPEVLALFSGKGVDLKGIRRVSGREKRPALIPAPGPPAEKTITRCECGGQSL